MTFSSSPLVCLISASSLPSFQPHLFGWTLCIHCTQLSLGRRAIQHFGSSCSSLWKPWSLKMWSSFVILAAGACSDGSSYSRLSGGGSDSGGLGEGGSVPRYTMLASKGMNDGHGQGLIHGQLLPSPHLLWTLWSPLQHSFHSLPPLAWVRFNSPLVLGTGPGLTQAHHDNF